jgi:peptide/nickel transport system substrate-binding protein
MTLYRFKLTAAAAAALLCPSLPGAAASYVETPAFAADVAAGKLEAVAERLPRTPSVVSMDGEKRPGRHGGDLRMLVGRAKDVRMLVVYGYARLVVYDTNYEIKPDILESIDVEEGRVFTLKLRPGHKWSDGAPFTAEDFRYYWEDVANNPELSPAGPPRDLLVDDEKPRFEVIDETTVRFSWSRPNPFFLPRLAGAAPLFIYRPSHYLKRFHVGFAEPAALEPLVKASGRRNWAALHNRRDNMYKFDNPELPTLQPWINTSKPPATRFVALRNPYYHRVDTAGRQLPYADRFILSVTDGKLIPAKAAAGETDLQSRGLGFNDFTVLKENEERNGYKVRLWRNGAGAHLALYPNLNVNDPGWRKLIRDARFRRALSMAIDRTLINNALYFGLAIEGNNTTLPESPLFRENYQTAWTKFDTQAANKLLDQIGLKERDGDGFRRLGDGRTMQIVVETAGEDTEQSDVLELIRDTWAEIGVKMFVKPSQREVFRNRIFAGETQMSIWSGYANGLQSPDMSPRELAPTEQIHLEWPKWGQHYETSGQMGEPPDTAESKELLDLYKRWTGALERAEREAIWHRMLEIHADQLFTIGIVSAVPQPVVVKESLQNVPTEGVYAWDPGAQLGIYRPDTFWFDQGG